ncbi:hypothetical protein B0H14DRAFT_3499953 [Mycena olivaceomarginata]|nr:hypothetical protein B0H14DRAFT_3499953 [Mycena olivaceomarginata]
MLITCAQVVLVDSSNCIPKVQQLLKEYFGEEPSNGINPDEGVTYGAAGTADVVLVDVSPLALSIKHMPSEQGQIGAIRELVNVYLKRWPALFTKLHRTHEAVLVILREVTGLLRQLGDVPSPVQDTVELLATLLAHPNHDIHVNTAWPLRCFSASPRRSAFPRRSWSFMELLQRDLTNCSRPPWDPMFPFARWGMHTASPRWYPRSPRVPSMSLTTHQQRFAALACGRVRIAGTEVEVAWTAIAAL